MEILKNPLEEKNKLAQLKIHFFKFSSFLESLLILAFWIFIFTNSASFGGYSREALLTYLLTGNVIGFISSFFLHRFIRNDIRQRDQNLLTKYPFQYLKIILLRGFGRNILPFVIAISLNALLIKLILGDLVFNFELGYIVILALMIAQAFIFEFLLAYIIRLFTFWVVSSKEIYIIAMRFKKIMAGNFFPLGLLSEGFLRFSFFLPFAYTFYVPTQFFLKEISPLTAVRGLFIQFIWICLLFLMIRYIVKKKISKQEKELKSL